ncbi:thiamine phosphate synthase [Phenylobacterium sp.]|uniref:thiamine phosphate synthase n=1 Tax=Phenylobacterium sp. TaxID=1871053 RepID=UPI002727F2B0|nr:thiamine phosphate synthase [Phenylobacterium sp.]MDO8378122.1 thiamine phosphate synthase [Phenylobacterium sp.]
MARTGACLRRRAAGRKPLPALLYFTDPARTPDPEAIAARLPRGSAIVYRSFGAVDALAVALRLKAIARQRGLTLLIGADEALAAGVGADGIHLPERLAHRARRIRARRPGWLITAAAHGPRAARAPVDAVVVSAIFPSGSASAGKPLGPIRLAQIVRLSRSPVYALGGVNAATAARLLATGVVGIAGIEAFAS